MNNFITLNFLYEPFMQVAKDPVCDIIVPELFELATSPSSNTD